MLLYDIDDWRAENARSLQLARRIVSITRLVPAHEYGNLDGFVSTCLCTTCTWWKRDIVQMRADNSSPIAVDPNLVDDNVASPHQGSQAVPLGRRSVW